jgi:integrase/recombinase XerD
MAGRKGIAAREHLRGRSKEQRGGKARAKVVFPRSDAHNLADYTDGYLESLAVRGYADMTITGRRYALDAFLQWCSERELIRAASITLPILESYTRHLYRFRKENGKPLSSSAQRSRITAVKELFRWLCRSHHILYNPASELEMPRKEKRLPEEPLTIAQVESVLGQPDMSDPLGVRDRAMMELFYSTGMRRSELAHLQLFSVNQERRTVQIRQGKGRKDRVVPVGARALVWLERYLCEVRPLLVLCSNETALFLSSYGEAFNPDVLSRKVSKYIKQADIGRKGSCHLFRHTCATHMLEGGADIRFIQQLLGHEKLETTQIYTEVSIQQLLEVHARTHPAKLRK